MESTTASGTPLPPHGPADMLDLFMTRYDYDYNRDPDGELRRAASGADGAFGEDWISGEVRNRPVFASGGPLAGSTTYRVDYVPRWRRADRAANAMKAVHLLAEGEGDGGAASPFAREWFRSNVSSRLDGDRPLSVYKKDYTPQLAGRSAAQAAAGLASAEGGQEGPLHAGATAVPYRADFLHPKGMHEDDGGDIVPKITSRESLLPRHTALADAEADPTGAAAAVRATRCLERAPPPIGDGGASLIATLNGELAPNDGKGLYTCTSWDYGDVSQAYPNQLPQGFEGSARVDLLASKDDTTDKAALLLQLAGKRPAPTRPMDGYGGTEVDRTNPIYLSPTEVPQCAVGKRIDLEGYVLDSTIYQSDFVHPGRLPELPGNPTPQDPRLTNVQSNATPGEMVSGQLTKHLRAAGALRNSHGYVTEAATRSTGSGAMGRRAAENMATIRAVEAADSIDRADVHRRKLHGPRPVSL